ncbi:single-stranded DNA-binding protein [[Clostridium] colinum]|uniref:single-stranded DNA-binding protein n=1 Tax=[Clostridium] colinum TaxID=36835 RepID=UPI0020259EDB|nr:single-stranded DNA-binding protein [[Clostridium] colinum]
MNKVQLIGRLTKDPEIKYTQSKESLAVTRFSVAVNRKYKKDSEQEVDFINCVSFGKQAEFVNNYFKKGQQIAIAGKIQTGSYKDNNGNTKYTFDVVTEEVEFCGGKTEEKNTQEVVEDDDYYIVDENIDDDNLPF